MDKDAQNLKIEALEQSPLVNRLVFVIETLQKQLAEQGERLAEQAEKIDALLAEIRHLKKIPAKPDIKPSTLPKEPKDPNDKNPPANGAGPNKRPGSDKRSKNKELKIDKEEMIAAQDIPEGSIRKGYEEFIVQELIIVPEVTQYRLERWKLPDGSYKVAQLPEGIKNNHFGPMLRAYILHQHHHQSVTHGLLHAQLLEFGIDISAGQLNRILTEDKEAFHEEKSGLLTAGLSVSDYVQTDDTGARHKGKNGYCTFIGNAFFSWFSSTESKSRVNFLELLRGEENEYALTCESFAYMAKHNVTPWICKKLQMAEEKVFADKEAFEKHLAALKIVNKHYVRIVTEAALIGSLLNHRFSKSMVILSDDAGQFNVFLHALCWVHAERGIKSLNPMNELQQKAVDWARNEIWEIYDALLLYKVAPSDEIKTSITERFNKFCNARTDYQTLNLRLKKFQSNKDELLLVLEHPNIPLHNNQSESDIREYVKRRKISGSTRSDEGRRCRDTFASLKKTAIKLGVGFWDYLLDRMNRTGRILPLPELVLTAAKG